MADESAQFFESLRERGHEPLLEQATGTLRLELNENGGVELWSIAVRKGDVAVSRRRTRADCTARLEKRLFGELARGEKNALTATLRGAIVVEGDSELLTLFQRIFPSPPNSGKR